MRGEIYKQMQIKSFIYRVLQSGGFYLFLVRRRLFFVISAIYVTFLLVVLSYFLYLCTRNKALAENGKDKKIRIGACPHPFQAT